MVNQISGKGYIIENRYVNLTKILREECHLRMSDEIHGYWFMPTFKNSFNISRFDIMSNNLRYENAKFMSNAIKFIKKTKEDIGFVGRLMLTLIKMMRGIKNE